MYLDTQTEFCWLSLFTVLFITISLLLNYNKYI